jgi:hypothetical protein
MPASLEARGPFIRAALGRVNDVLLERDKQLLNVAVAVDGQHPRIAREVLEHGILVVTLLDERLDRDRGQEWHNARELLRDAPGSGEVGDDKPCQVREGRDGLRQVAALWPIKVEDDGQVTAPA